MIILSKWITPKKGMVKLLPLPRLLLHRHRALGVCVSRGAACQCVLHVEACLASAACPSCLFSRVIDDCQSLADASGRVRGDLGRSWDSLGLNKCLNSNISLQILRRGGGNFPHKVKNIEYWIGILNPSASLGALKEQGVMSRCCSRP